MNNLNVPTGQEPEYEKPEPDASVSEVVREMTGDGREVIKFLMSVMKGRVKTAKVADRMKAAVELLDRGYGKPRPSASVLGDSERGEVGPSIAELGGAGVWPMEPETVD